MGSIRCAKLAQGYAAPARPGQTRCQDCAHRTVVMDARSRRRPYCQLGGFMVWSDAGCDLGRRPALGQERP